jgi:hypothetical protein
MIMGEPHDDPHDGLVYSDCDFCPDSGEENCTPECPKCDDNQAARDAAKGET